MNMKGDFSRVTFNPAKHFTSVLMQQGRVQLDADWNEQAAILLWQIRLLARSVIGEFGAAGAESFKVTQTDNGDLQVAKGVYFVHGIAVENPGQIPVVLPTPPRTTGPSNPVLANGGDLAPGTVPTAPRDGQDPPSWSIYLAVWERIVTYLDDPSIREIALGGGIDTTVRTQVRSSIVVRPEGELDPARGLPQLQVGLDGGPPSTDACNIAPDAKYRGAGNQLYRIEIHDTWVSNKAGATFKWSRENASLVFPVTKVEGTTLFFGTLGRDHRLTIHPGDYLEFESTDIPWTQALPLGRVKTVDTDNATVTVDQVPDSFKVVKDKGKDNLAAVRRWDHSQPNSSGLTPVTEGTAISIENGLNITFQTSSAQDCRRGDYWLVPARTGVVWMPPSSPFAAERPQYYLAPLANFSLDASGNPGNLTDQRMVFEPLAKHV